MSGVVVTDIFEIMMLDDSGKPPCFKYLTDKSRALHLLALVEEDKTPDVLYLHEVCFLSDPWDEKTQDETFERLMKDISGPLH